MTYEEIWKKIKRMKQWERSMLAYEMMLKGFNVGYVHPHYYFDAKAIHDIVFYAPHKQWEIEDPPQPSLEGGSSDSKGNITLHDYYLALKEIVENDKEIHIRVKRYALLPRFINDWREGKIVKKYICSRTNEQYVNAWYRILLGKSLAGERSRSFFMTLGNGEETVYKMIEYKNVKGVEEMTFQRTNKYQNRHSCISQDSHPEFGGLMEKKSGNKTSVELYMEFQKKHHANGFITFAMKL